MSLSLRGVVAGAHAHALGPGQAGHLEYVVQALEETRHRLEQPARMEGPQDGVGQDRVARDRRGHEQTEAHRACRHPGGSIAGLQTVTCLDAPLYRPREIVKKFWAGINAYPAPKTKLVTFNGRGFDMPMLELAAFRHGLSLRDYCQKSRNRYGGNHFDLLDWLTNFGACRLAGGLNLLSKMLGKPGKMEVAGDQVYRMFLDGRLQEINDYCLCDTLDTYFVFLRTRVMTGDISPEQESDLVQHGREFLERKTLELPALRAYLANWAD